MSATRVVIDIPGERRYSVRIGGALLEGIGEYCRGIKELSSCPHVVIVTDSHAGPLYLDAVRNSFIRAEYKVSDIEVGAGEESKSVAVADELWQAFASLGIGRDCAVVALGGGVIGDLAGFAGSTYMRGLPIIQVPTTLLSMVDSSVGGKTGVNLPAGKNLVGTFTQPSYVCASTDTLSTLPEREWQCGLGEVAKSAVIDGDDFFFWLMDASSELRMRSTAYVEEAIRRCVVFKANVVAQDKTESCGVRECLNYGHTLAHAIELLAGYGRFSHGAAVAEGMRFAAYLSLRLCDASPDFVEAQSKALDSLGLARLDWSAPSKQIVEAMHSDKKARGGKIKFVLVRDVGDWLLREVDDGDVMAALDVFYR